MTVHVWCVRQNLNNTERTDRAQNLLRNSNTGVILLKLTVESNGFCHSLEPHDILSHWISMDVNLCHNTFF